MNKSSVLGTILSTAIFAVVGVLGLGVPQGLAQGSGPIAIKFVGTGTAMAGSEVAGVVASAHWNNASNAVSSAPLALVDASGAPSGASVTWRADSTSRTSITDAAGNYRLMRGYLDNGAQHPTTVTVSGLPLAGYDVYVYADGNNGWSTRTGAYQLSGPGIQTTTVTLTDAARVNFAGRFVPANNSAGNYIKFTINGTGFTLTATPGSSSSYAKRAPVNGLQIVRAGASAAAVAATYSLSGLVSPTALGTGTTLSLSGSAAGTSGTTSGGAYSFAGLANGTYLVTPSRAGFTFTPTARTVTISGADVTGVGFTANPITYSISGTAGAGAGVTMTLTGDSSAITAANSSGNYAFNGLSNGAYVVTPSLTGYTFTPASAPVTIAGANVTGANFTAAAVPETVVFYDDFAGTALDGTQWTAMNRPGDASNNEAQCYQPANVAVANGSLSITARAQSAVCNGATYGYTSGMVQWSNFSFLYGTVEIRAKLAGGQGPWPALWLLGTDCQQQNVTLDPNGPCNWPATGSDEIDIADVLYGNHTSFYQWIHSNATNAGCIPTTTDVSQNWHTYRLDWAPGSLVWLIDGVTTCTMTTGVPSTPMFLMLNVAVGGNGGGAITPSTLPQTAAIDYVKVTQK